MLPTRDRSASPAESPSTGVSYRIRTLDQHRPLPLRKVLWDRDLSSALPANDWSRHRPRLVRHLRSSPSACCSEEARAGPASQSRRLRALRAKSAHAHLAESRRCECLETGFIGSRKHGIACHHQLTTQITGKAEPSNATMSLRAMACSCTSIARYLPECRNVAGASLQAYFVGRQLRIIGDAEDIRIADPLHLELLVLHVTQQVRPARIGVGPSCRQRSNR